MTKLNVSTDLYSAAASASDCSFNFLANNNNKKTYKLLKKIKSSKENESRNLPKPVVVDNESREMFKKKIADILMKKDHASDCLESSSKTDDSTEAYAKESFSTYKNRVGVNLKKKACRWWYEC
uniref:Somatostatin domain-containing protein n=1 Tax=Rhabditophanes sp. KR3021 TaxID=114890 RepID=A0AC35TPU5_9BILA